MLEGFFEFLISIGPIGLFLAAIIGNATLFLPLPVDILIIPVSTIDFFGLGVITPLILGIIVGVGSSIGEFSGYFIGIAGIKGFESMSKKEIKQLHVIKDKLNKVGIPLIAFFAFTPLPFDILGLAAGLAKYSKTKFFIGSLLGKVPRYIILSYAGYYGIGFLIHLLGV
jgi:membrane protein YqaA with SNARE-associated domain